MWGEHLVYTPWEIEEAVPLNPTGLLLRYAILPSTKSVQLYLIHRNNHREAAKVRRQRNMVQMKEQIKTPKKN